MPRKKHGFGLNQPTAAQLYEAMNRYWNDELVGRIVKIKNPYNNPSYDFMFSKLYRVIAFEYYNDIPNSLLFITNIENPNDYNGSSVRYKEVKFMN
jgi:hypothetical protein